MTQWIKNFDASIPRKAFARTKRVVIDWDESQVATIQISLTKAVVLDDNTVGKLADLGDYTWKIPPSEMPNTFPRRNPANYQLLPGPEQRTIQDLYIDLYSYIVQKIEEIDNPAPPATPPGE